MSFGHRLRELRQERHLTLRELAELVGVGFTYLSKIENHRLPEGHSPSEQLIHKLACELECDEDHLLILAEKVPHEIRKRVCERPEAFRVLAGLNDKEMDALLQRLEGHRLFKSK